MVQTLNKEQKEFFYHVLHLIKVSDEAFYCFLSGGAGVGKSHVTKALQQAALKYYNSRSGDNFNNIKVLILAPTGKADYNVKGYTIHSALAIPGVIWVQFDHADVGQKTRHENRHLHREGIEPSWTPIKPVTTQFAVGQSRTIQVVRKQLPLRPAAAKTIHRSQGDTETRVVVNFETRRAFPHIHYVGLSTVTTIEGLHITDLCEDKN